MIIFSNDKKYKAEFITINDQLFLILMLGLFDLDYEFSPPRKRYKPMENYCLSIQKIDWDKSFCSYPTEFKEKVDKIIKLQVFA